MLCNIASLRVHPLKSSELIAYNLIACILQPECFKVGCYSAAGSTFSPSLLSPIQRFGVGEVVLGVILTPVGDLRATFSDFLRYWKDIGIFIDLA